jgi:hypothetical protein
VTLRTFVSALVVASAPALLVACAPETVDSGTAVGNLDARLRLTTSAAADVSGYTGAAMVTSVGLLGCDGRDQLLAADIDLALDGASALALPSGAWCGLSLAPAGPLVWEGTSVQGFSFSVTLDVGTLSLRSPSAVDVVDGLRLLWRLGSPRWLSAEELGADEEDVVIGPGDSEHDELVDLLRRGQRLLRDDDDDGEADEDEDARELAEPEEEEDEPPDTERDGRDNDGDGLVDEPDEREEDPNEDPSDDDDDDDDGRP